MVDPLPLYVEVLEALIEHGTLRAELRALEGQPLDGRRLLSAEASHLARLRRDVAAAALRLRTLRMRAFVLKLEAVRSGPVGPPPAPPEQLTLFGRPSRLAAGPTG